MTEPVERRKLHPEVEMVLHAIQSRDDAITALRGDVQSMPDQIGQAIQAANMRTVSDPAFWAAAGEALQREARNQAGGFVLGGLRSVGTKIGWLLLIVGGVYLVVGWSGLAALWKSVFAAHG